MRRQSLIALLLSLCAASALADDGMTSFHYLDLYNIQQAVSGMQGLQGLRVDLYVTSNRPDVTPQDITLTLHRASGAEQPIPHDAWGHTLLPVSDSLKAENPLIVTNQPKHTLSASVVIDLEPPVSGDLRYDALMLGVVQLNDAIASKRLGALAKLYGDKADGLLVFYNAGEHSLTLHRKGGDQILKSQSVDKQSAHLKGINKDLLIPSTQVIYVPLDAATLEENPRITLDAPPAQVFPAF